jgi:hypothetical protein
MMRASRDDPALREACWWYLVFAGWTATAKVACLASVYRQGSGFVLDEIAVGRTHFARSHLLALILARDIVETAGVAAVVYALGQALPRRATALQRAAAVVLLLVMGANYLSLTELGTFVSANVLATAWGWVWLHPSTIRAYLTPGAGLAVLLGVLGVFVPTLASRGAPRVRAIGALHRSVAIAAAVLVGLGMACSVLAGVELGASAFAAQGYWERITISAWQGSETTPLTSRALPEPELLAEYRKIAFVPRGGSSAPNAAASARPSNALVTGQIKPRHILIVGLETAARAFYPLTTATDLPTFHRMTGHAIVSDHHYTTSPYTRIANFSILSGLYAPPSGLPVRFGPIGTDGVAAVLRTRGYETTYIDSWVLDWLPGSGERDQARMLGFDTVLDSSVLRDDGVYEVLVEGEKVAFDRAASRVLAAEEAGHKALVFVGTMLGHSPWPAAENRQALDGAARLHEIALVFDGLLDRFLSRLSERGLADDVLVLVAGDHGLRYAAEFESLGLRYSHSDFSFDVPFLLYAPGLVDSTVTVPFATSHVDIAPTLLRLVGVDTTGMFHDGQYMLDAALADRVLYLSNSRLGPLDGLRWNGTHLTFHALSRIAECGDGAKPDSMLPLDESPLAKLLPTPLRDPAALIGAFAAHTDHVAARLLQRGAASRTAR